MIKRLIAITLSILVIFSLAGCADTGKEPDISEPDVTVLPVEEEEETTATEATTEVTTTNEEVTTTTEKVTTEVTTTTEEVTTEAATTTEATTTEAATTTTEATTVTTTEAATTAAATTAAPEPEYGDPSVVVINEVCSSAKDSVTDFEGKSPDWIELYNPSSFKVNLKGYGVSDDPSDLLKWVLPDVEISAGGYLIIYCSDNDTYTNGECHTNFKLSGGNESVYLSTPAGKKQDEVMVPETASDMTYARYPDGSDTFEIISATPGKKNSSADNVEDKLPMPVFSKRSGFYDKQFSLKLTADEGTTIYYTTDGSVPTTSSAKYSSSITIKDRSTEKAVLTYKKPTTVGTDEEFPKQEFEKATIIRAIAVDENGKQSDVATATYFIGNKVIEKYQNVRVISVVADPYDLYDYETGIYVPGKAFDEWRKENPNEPLDGGSQANYTQRGSEWEKLGHIDFFSNSSKLEFSEDVGIRVHGGWSRNSQQKSLRFYMRAEYGESKLKYELFENNTSYFDGSEIKSYKRFMIRNGGNDSYLLKFKDQWIQSLFVNRGYDFCTQDDELVICFLDGEYWGLYALTEVYDKYYIEDHFGVDKDDVIMVKAGGLEEGEQEGDDGIFWDDMWYLETADMTVKENYEKACELFDMDSFCDYVAAETYIDNQDWIWGNWACWRTRSVTEGSEYGDGRWRFMMYDTEYSMDLYNNGSNYKEEYISKLLEGDGNFGKALVNLLKNDDFKTKLILAYEDVMNIAFDIDYACDRLQEYSDEYGPYIEQHFDRFVTWQSLWGVRKNVENFQNWVKNRYNAFPSMMIKLYGLPSNTKLNSVQLERTDGGTVTVNGKTPPFENGNSPYTWDGQYLSGYKITIKAVPEEGYEFAGWSGSYSGDAATIVVNPNKTVSLKAIFVKK